MTVNCNRHLAGDAEAAQRLLPADWPHRKASRLVVLDGLSWHLQFHPAKKTGGPLLLLLHGTGSSAHSWSELIDPLTEFADVLAWLATMANICDIDLERAIARKYLEGGGPKGVK